MIVFSMWGNDSRHCVGFEEMVKQEIQHVWNVHLTAARVLLALDLSLVDFCLRLLVKQRLHFHSRDEAKMSGISASELAQDDTLKTSVTRSDPENQLNAPFILYEPLPIIKKRSLGAGVRQSPQFNGESQADLSAVHIANWRVRYDSDDLVAFSDGMARCHDH